MSKTETKLKRITEKLLSLIKLEDYKDIILRLDQAGIGNYVHYIDISTSKREIGHVEILFRILQTKQREI